MLALDHLQKSFCLELSRALESRNSKDLVKFINSLKKEERILLIGWIWQFIPADVPSIQRFAGDTQVDMIGFVLENLGSVFREPPGSTHQASFDSGDTEDGSNPSPNSNFYY